MTLEEKRNQMIDHGKKQISLLNDREELIRKSKNYYLKRIEKLRNYDLFKKEIAISLIEDLVSEVEGKKYSVQKLHVETNHEDNSRTVAFEYTFLYLVEDSKKEEALAEIKKKYNINDETGKLVISSSSVMNVEDSSENYMKLSFYDRYSGSSVKFTNEKEPHVVTINVDDRFKYIYDFVEELIEAKLNSDTISISEDEMKKRMNSFSIRQKNSKKYLLENKEE